MNRNEPHPVTVTYRREVQREANYPHRYYSRLYCRLCHRRVTLTLSDPALAELEQSNRWVFIPSWKHHVDERFDRPEDRPDWYVLDEHGPVPPSR